MIPGQPVAMHTACMDHLRSNVHQALGLFLAVQGVPPQLLKLLVKLLVHFSEIFADLFEPHVLDREGILGLLSFAIQVPNFVICFRLSFVRIAQARLLPIQGFFL